MVAVLALSKVAKRPGKAGASTGNAAAATLAAILAKSIAFIAPCKIAKNVATPVNDNVIIFNVLPILFNWLTIKSLCCLILSKVALSGQESVLIYFCTWVAIKFSNAGLTIVFT